MKDTGIPHKDRLRKIAQMQPLVRPQKRVRTIKENQKRKAYLYALFDEREPDRFCYIGCTEHLRYRFTAYYADDLSKQPVRLREWLEEVGVHLSAKVLAIVPMTTRLSFESAMIRSCLGSGHPLRNANFQGCHRSESRPQPKRKSLIGKKYNFRAGRVTIKQDIYERNQKELASRF